MAFKLVIFSCLLAWAHGSVAPVAYAAAPLVAAAPVAARLEQFDTFPQYRFGYDVADSLTGDYKSQTEQRDGDVVQGQYSLVEADGTRRIVDYAADPVNGFNAIVRREPLVAAAPAVVAETGVVAARLSAVPAAPVAPIYAHYATAPVYSRYAAAPVAPAAASPVVSRYASAPVFAARYATSPVVAAVPVSAAYRATPFAYTAPFAPAYAPAAVAAAPAKLVVRSL